MLLVGGLTIAAALQPASYDPIRDTISALAAPGANDPWVMTLCLAGVGVCYSLTALGLRPARRLGRAALASGGLATLLIAAFHISRHGYSTPHAFGVVAAAIAMCAWPVLAARRRHPARLLTLPASISTTAVILGLTVWFALEQHHAAVGLAERFAAIAAALSLFPVAATTRRSPARYPSNSQACSGAERISGGSQQVSSGRPRDLRAHSHQLFHVTGRNWSSTGGSALAQLDGATPSTGRRGNRLHDGKFRPSSRTSRLDPSWPRLAGLREMLVLAGDVAQRAHRHLDASGARSSEERAQRLDRAASRCGFRPATSPSTSASPTRSRPTRPRARRPTRRSPPWTSR